MMASSSKGSIAGYENYLTKEEKTDIRLIETKGCTPNFARDFAITKNLNGKTEGIQFHEIIQSFKPGETNEWGAHYIGREMLKHEKFKDFQVVLVTHKDRDHIHNHIVINSVSHITGKKYHQKKNELREFKEYSNEICQKHGLSYLDLDKKAAKYITQKENKILKSGKISKKEELRGVIENAVKKSLSLEDLSEYLKKNHNVEVKLQKKNIKFKHPDLKNFMNGKRLGDAYSKDTIENITKKNRIEIKEKEKRDSPEFKLEEFESRLKEAIKINLSEKKEIEKLKRKIELKDSSERSFNDLIIKKKSINREINIAKRDIKGFENEFFKGFFDKSEIKRLKNLVLNKTDDLSALESQERDLRIEIESYSNLEEKLDEAVIKNIKTQTEVRKIVQEKNEYNKYSLLYFENKKGEKIIILEKERNGQKQIAISNGDFKFQLSNYKTSMSAIHDLISKGFDLVREKSRDINREITEKTHDNNWNEKLRKDFRKITPRIREKEREIDIDL